MNPITRFILALVLAMFSGDSLAGASQNHLALSRNSPPHSCIYLYAHANPVNNTDPSGNFSFSEVNIVGALQAALRTGVSVSTRSVLRSAGRAVILIAASVGSYSLEQLITGRPATNPTLVAAIQRMDNAIKQHRRELLEFARKNGIEYQTVDDIPHLQKIEEGIGFNLVDFEMVTSPITGMTRVSQHWLNQKSPVKTEVQLAALLSHEYGHRFFRHIIITPWHEDEANSFQEFFEPFIQ